MKVSLKWLSQYIDLKGKSVEEIEEIFSLQLTEVEEKYQLAIELALSKNINTLVVEIQEDGDEFFAFGKTVDTDPKGLNKKLVKYVNELEEFSFDVPSVKDREIMFWNIDKYAMDLSTLIKLNRTQYIH